MRTRLLASSDACWTDPIDANLAVHDDRLEKVVREHRQICLRSTCSPATAYNSFYRDCYIIVKEK